jgi:hypothetical protein
VAARRLFMFEASAPASEPLRCSAKGCRQPAVWALRWNNPKLHPPERRKTWLACEDHRDSLADFLSRRGFLREIEPTSTLNP